MRTIIPFTLAALFALTTGSTMVAMAMTPEVTVSKTVQVRVVHKHRKSPCPKVPDKKTTTKGT